MKQIFSSGSPYTRHARFIAVIWTLLIIIGCLTPARELPRVDVPLIDKWTHLVLFGAFTFLWFCARPGGTNRQTLILFFVSVLFGSFIEVMQGMFASLGRSMELMDVIADGIGGALGIGVFCLGRYLSINRQ